MTPERYSEVKDIFQRAVELRPDRRADYLNSACGSDPEMRAEVESLLAVHEAGQSQLIDKPLAKLVPDLGKEESPDVSGRRVGPYRIERLLGEGGMGAVYEASRADDQFQQRVALKLVKGSAYFQAALSRFRQERQILAALTHPHIARLLDGGLTPEGQPFFVMEYVDGKPIDKYCEEKRLGIRERLKLFRDVCAAVQYAHQNLIVHRDLKPGNILVTAEGEVKLLDFGIAKLLTQGADSVDLTMTGMRVMTPEYASPEQLRGVNVTTAADVYSLGVVLYELITGTRPFKLKERLLGEMERIICEQEPASPSMAVTQAGASTIGDTKPERLRRTLTGDLDNIVLLALRKEPQRRYSSAEALSEDVRRYLDGETVTAHPPTFTYRSAKFVRRHRTAVVVACLLLFSLTGGILATWRQKLQADSEAAKAKAVIDFLQNDLLAQASASAQAKPDNKPDPDLKVRTALERAAARIAGKFDRQPLVEASIRQTIGTTYLDLGLYPEAQGQVERALDLRRRVLGPEHPDTLTSMHGLAVLYRSQGKYAQAEPLYTKVLEVQRRVLGPEHHDTLDTMNDRANLYGDQGKYAQAEPLYTKVLEVQRRTLGPEHPDTLATMYNLAALYQYQGKYAQAEPLYTKALETLRRVEGPEHPTTLTTMDNLAGLYYHQGNYAQAEPLFTKALEVKLRVLGSEHHNSLASMNNLAALYSIQGKYAQAEPLITKVLEVYRRVLGAEHPDTLTMMNNLAVLDRNEGKYAQAEPLFTKALEVRQRVLGPEHPDTLTSKHSLAVLYQSQGKYAEAEPLFTTALEDERRVLGPEHPVTLTSMNNLAVMYRSQGRYAQAELLLTKVLEVRRRVLGPERPATLSTINDLAALYLNQSKYAQAEPLLREALNSYQKSKTDTWDRYNCQSLLGASLAGQKKYAEAEPLLLASYEGMHQRETTIPFAQRSDLERGAERIVQLYQGWGKPEKAAEWRKKL